VERSSRVGVDPEHYIESGGLWIYDRARFQGIGGDKIIRMEVSKGWLGLLQYSLGRPGLQPFNHKELGALSYPYSYVSLTLGRVLDLLVCR
jgi:hypothetical protein